ncbi:thiamine-phosphate kinase [Chloroflexota bacterium]
MKVAEIGEFGLIDLLARMIAGTRSQQSLSWQNLVLGIGDDAAVWRGDASLQLATVDSLIQDVHFSLEIMPWYDLGWKALAVNLSDIAAMGGVPKYVLVALALPGETEVEDIEEFCRGMLALADQQDVALVGGDTCRAPLVTVTTTVLGKGAGDGQKILARSAAQPGDRVAVTGFLGGAAAGLEMLRQGLEITSEAAEASRQAFLKPFPRVKEGQLLVKNGVKAAIDISDGLVADLGHLCQSSGVSARIQVDRVPLHPGVRDNFPDRALELVLSGGEDYELLFTAQDEVVQRVRQASKCPVTVIGEIEAGKGGVVYLVDVAGEPVNLAKMGWEHFQVE